MPMRVSSRVDPVTVLDVYVGHAECSTFLLFPHNASEIKISHSCLSSPKNRLGTCSEQLITGCIASMKEWTKFIFLLLPFQSCFQWKLIIISSNFMFDSKGVFYFSTKLNTVGGGGGGAGGRQLWKIIFLPPPYFRLATALAAKNRVLGSPTGPAEVKTWTSLHVMGVKRV